MYYVLIEDAYGQKIQVEVSKEIFELYREFERDDTRFRHEYERKIDHHPIEWHYGVSTESAESIFIKNEELNSIYHFLNEFCTPTQKTRFILHYVDKLTYKEIAELQNCDIKRVQKSIYSVFQKFQKFIKK